MAKYEVNLRAGYTEEVIERYKTKQVEDSLDGWRWIKAGEAVLPGDYLCDPRCKPVEVDDGWVQTESHHEVKTRRRR